LSIDEHTALTTTQATTLWTSTFALLCIVQLLGYAQQAMLNPTVPLYITQLGGSPFVVGLAISSFAATSVIARPFVGYWSDRRSECGVLGVGLVMLAVSMLLCFFPFVIAVLVANSLRGIGWAGLNAGGYALLARIAPDSRRGEASGYYSGAQSTPTVVFPAIALWLLQTPFGSYNLVFAIMIALGLAGAAVCYLMARQIPNVLSQAEPHQLSAPWWRQIITLSERDVLLPAALMFCNQLSFPAITSFIVLYAREIGIDSLGSYFVVSGITSVIARPLLGRVSDRIGVGYSLVATFTLQTVSLILLVFGSSLAMILIAGVLYMLGMALGGSATLIIAMKRATPERRGRFMASFSMAYPLGYGLGALITGSAIDTMGYSSTYLLLAALGASGLLLTIIKWSELQ
jgi:MFS family permease